LFLRALHDFADTNIMNQLSQSIIRPR